MKLSFSRGNAKLSKDIYTFSLPAGHTCPGAHLCASYADRVSGKITDGQHTEFRCFAASQESMHPSVRKSRWTNYEMLKAVKTADAMAELILSSLDTSAKYVRIHVSGDFFNSHYFRAWAYVATQRPLTIFYAYTKSIKIVRANLSVIPENFRLTLSEGGKNDSLIPQLGIKSAKVVFSPEEADILGLTVDHDDSHAFDGNESFALLLHGTQKSGTDAARALNQMRKDNVKFSYSK